MNLFRRLWSRVSKAFSSDLSLQRVAKNSGWLMGSQGATTALDLVQSVLVARHLGAGGFGVLALVTAYSGAVNRLTDSRAWETAIKYVVRYQERGEPGRAAAVAKLCFLVDAVTALVAFGFLYVTAALAARLFVHEPGAELLIRLYAASVLIRIPMGTSSALMRVADNFSWMARQAVIQSSVRLGAVVVVVLSGGGLVEMIIAYLAGTAGGATAAVFLGVASARQLRLPSIRRTPLAMLRGRFREHFSFLAFTNLAGTSRIVSSKADLFILGWLTSPAEVGVYRIARKIADPFVTFIAPLYSAVYPEVSRLFAREAEVEFFRFQRRLMKALVTVFFPAAGIVAVAVIWAVPLFFGAEFSPAVPLAQIMVWQVIWVPLIAFPGYLLSTGRAGLLAGLNWLDAAVYVGLLLVLVSRFSALGAAVATLARIVIWTGLAITILLRTRKRTVQKVV